MLSVDNAGAHCAKRDPELRAEMGVAPKFKYDA